MSFKPVVLTILLLAAIATAVVLLFPLDTQYSPGYSQRAFRSIRIGDTEQTVISRLGPAFTTNHCRPYTVWLYCADNQPRFAQRGEASGTYTQVTLNDGVVTNILGVTQNERTLTSTTLTVGPTAGYLKLTPELVESLVGVSEDAFKQKFGPPRSVYDFKASKILAYSRSPSGGNYRLRQIGFNDRGTVVYIASSIWWD